MKKQSFSASKMVLCGSVFLEGVQFSPESMVNIRVIKRGGGFPLLFFISFYSLLVGREDPLSPFFPSFLKGGGRYEKASNLSGLSLFERG